VWARTLGGNYPVADEYPFGATSQPNSVIKLDTRAAG
jgi:hypothetical protein